MYIDPIRTPTSSYTAPQSENTSTPFQFADLSQPAPSLKGRVQLQLKAPTYSQFFKL